MESSDRIREDFDRIARLTQADYDHNAHFHTYLLRRIPPRCRETLDIGCGKGDFSRLLAARSERVTAVDFSPEMIRRAREESAAFPNIEFQNADVRDWAWPQSRYDCIVSIATLHHLPPGEILRRCASALVPGGTLAILDLCQAAEPADYLPGALSFPLSVALRIAHTGRLRTPPSAREAWEIHGRHETYLSPAEVRGICRDVLPGAEVRRHLLWRYSIVWRKPAG